MAKTETIPKTVLYAVRHGETEWNVAGIQQGHLDSPLTKNGVAQANQLAAGLEMKGIDCVFSSDLGRAAQTADIIASNLGLTVERNEGLRERNLGVMQGLTQAEFAKDFPNEFAIYRTHNPDYAFPDGESARQRHDRSIRTSNTIIELNQGKTVLIVAHGGVLNSMLTHALSLEINAPRRFSLFNGAINKFSITDGVWRLDTWGDLSHLEDEQSLDDR